MFAALRFYISDVLSGNLIKESMQATASLAHNIHTIVAHTDHKHFPRELLVELKPLFEALFDHYTGKLKFVPSEKENVKGTIPFI